MPQKPTRINLPEIPDGLPQGLYELLTAIIYNYQMDRGDFLIGEKRPTVDDLIAAGITNADKIT